MNQLTTIASLPSGGGSKSALTAEVGDAKPNHEGATLTFCGKTYVIRKPAYVLVDLGAGDDRTGIYAFEGGGLVRIGDVVTPADKHGFEPFAYCERS